MGSNSGHGSFEFDEIEAMQSRGRFRILGKSGAVVGFALVVVASALAFALTSSTAARTTLPAQLEIAANSTTTSTSSPPSVTSTTATTTTTVVIGSTTSTTAAPTSTSVSTTTIPETLGDGKTTVVKAVPTVRVEDDNGKQLDYEANEPTSPTSDDTSSKDR